MPQVENKLQLATRLVLRYLEDLDIIKGALNLEWQEKSSKNATVLAPVTASAAFPAHKKDVSEIEIVLLEMSNSEKFMVNICSDDVSLAQGIFPYVSVIRDALSIKFPLEADQADKLYTKESYDSLQDKLKLGPQQPKVQVRSEDRKAPDNETKDHIFKERIERMVANQPPPNPQVPGFDDEYEVQTGPGIPSSGEFGVPGLGMPVGGYGDRDLYPDGMRFPQDFDPLRSRNENPQGGMIYDPFRGPGPSPNPLANNNRQRPGQDATPGAPNFPGIKYDDPYGRINRQGGGGGFI